MKTLKDTGQIISDVKDRFRWNARGEFGQRDSLKEQRLVVFLHRNYTANYRDRRL